MPGMDGFETTELIKQRERTKHIPIIFLTAISKDEAHVFRGYEVGAVDYVFKPFEPEMLRSKVAVFVDLHRKNEEIARQAELLRERELEAERRLSEERYRQLADAMPQIVGRPIQTESDVLQPTLGRVHGHGARARPMSWTRASTPTISRTWSRGGAHARERQRVRERSTASGRPTARTGGTWAARFRSATRAARSSSGWARRPTSTTTSGRSRRRVPRRGRSDPRLVARLPRDPAIGRAGRRARGRGLVRGARARARRAAAARHRPRRPAEGRVRGRAPAAIPAGRLAVPARRRERAIRSSSRKFSDEMLAAAAVDELHLDILGNSACGRT